MRVSIGADDPLPTFQARDDKDEESPCMLVPVALQQATASLDKDTSSSFEQLDRKGCQT